MKIAEVGQFVCSCVGSGSVLLAIGSGLIVDGAGAQECEFGSYFEGSYLATNGNYSFIESGDLDGDGHLDLVGLGLQNTGDGSDLGVLFGDGAGGFSEFVLGTVNPRPKALRLGDLNGDGLLDIVISAWVIVDIGNMDQDPVLLVYMGLGDGQFSEQVEYRRHRVEDEPAGEIELGDFDHDGDLDVIMAGGFYNDSVVSGALIFLGNGDGSFAESTIVPGFEEFARFVELGDINGDGHLDAVLSIDVSRTGLVTLLGVGDGTFVSVANESPRSASRTFRGKLEIGDIDHDGNLDVVLTNISWLNIFQGNGAGEFEERQETLFGGTQKDIKLVDLNGDGELDAVGVGRQWPVVWWGSNNGFEFDRVWYHYYPQEGNPQLYGYELTVGDVDHAGGLDIVVTHPNSKFHGISVMLQACSQDCPSDLNGDGRYTSIDHQTALIGFSESSIEMDFNGDGVVNFFDISVFMQGVADGCP